MTWWFILSWVLGAAILFDGLRRPHEAWVHADRERSWWLSTTGALALFGLGVLGALLYGIGVLPRLSTVQPTDDRFRRR
jgi:hypothetical protein